MSNASPGRQPPGRHWPPRARAWRPGSGPSRNRGLEPRITPQPLELPPFERQQRPVLSRGKVSTAMSTILLVDDQPELLELYTEVLEMMDHRVLHAHDGEEALEVAHARRPDLVVTDWKMPRMDGVELCEQLHHDEALSDIPIILHSSTADPHAPGVQFIPKGSSLEQFESLVSRVLSGCRVARAARCSSRQEQRAPPAEQPGSRPARGRVRSSASPLPPGRTVEERQTWSTWTRAAQRTLHAAWPGTR